MNIINLMKKLLLFIFTISLGADTGTLIKIVDGDTLYFKTSGKTVKCRIEYIDTPESSNNRKNKQDTSLCSNISNRDMVSAGKSATRAAKRLLTMDKLYKYEVNGKDRYGRSICIVKINNSTFNEQMIQSGYAVPYRKYMNSKEVKYYNSLLTKAKNAKLGLWKDRPAVVECLNQARK